MRTGVSLGDTLAGLHAVIGAMNAIYYRDVVGTGEGQLVDTAISESVFNMMESLLPEYDFDGEVRERSGAKLSGIVPSNTYKCKDGRYVIIGGNGDGIFLRLMKAIGRSDLAADKNLGSNQGRVREEGLIDAAISDFTEQHTFDEVFTRLDEVSVPVGPINSIADIVSDPQFQARGVFEKVELSDGEELKIPRLSPLLEKTPAQTNWPGPKLGEFNEEIFCEWLGLSKEEVLGLKKLGAI